jgi:hypothetical protein
MMFFPVNGILRVHKKTPQGLFLGLDGVFGSLFQLPNAPFSDYGQGKPDKPPPLNPLFFHILLQMFASFEYTLRIRIITTIISGGTIVSSLFSGRAIRRFGKRIIFYPFVLGVSVRFAAGPGFPLLCFLDGSGARAGAVQKTYRFNP